MGWVFCMQWGTFIFFAGCVIVETILVALLFVEPKAVPIEDCPFLFKRHWFWKRCLTITHTHKITLGLALQTAQTLASICSFLCLCIHTSAGP